MSEHLTQQKIDQYRQRIMSAPELLSTTDHLAACKSCRELANDSVAAETTISLLRSNLLAEAAKPADHLTYEQLAFMVDGKLDSPDRELVESHLESCSLCAEEMDDLRVFSSTISSGPQPLVTGAIATGTATRGRERLRAIWSLFGAISLPRFATVSAAALVLILTAVSVVFILRSSPTEITQGSREQEKSSPPSTPEASPETSPVVESNNNAASPSPQPIDVGTSEKVPQLVVALNDEGGRISLDSEGKIGGLDELSPDARRAVKKALMSERLEASAATAELARTAGTLLGTGDGAPSFAVLGPLGTIVRDERPQFRWRALDGAASYKVTVLDSDFNVVATSPPLTVTNWSPSSGLARGLIYSWQVAAVTGDGRQVLAPTAPAPEARFKILERDKVSELVRAERSSHGSHLVRGVLYARVGLLNDAERELRALVAANPQSPSARKLLRSIQTIRGKGQK